MSVLEAQGYPTVCPTLPSIDASPPTVDLPDDAKLIRSQLQRLVEDERKEVVVVVHSYGGVVGSEAVTQELGAEQRGRQGLDGGVIRLLYICAFVVPVGHSLAGAVGGTLPPWIQIQVRHLLALRTSPYLNCLSFLSFPPLRKTEAAPSPTRPSASTTTSHPPTKRIGRLCSNPTAPAHSSPRPPTLHSSISPRPTSTARTTKRCRCSCSR